MTDDQKLCEKCDEFRNEIYEISGPSELDEYFPYGELQDDETYNPNVHPNCRCVVLKET